MHPTHHAHHSYDCVASQKVNGAAIGDGFLHSVFYPLKRALENPHSQLIFMGNCGPEGEHPKAFLTL